MRVGVIGLSVFLVYLMTPGAVEITENLAHLAAHGDIAHGNDHGDTQSSDEHGCSGPYHFCVCHHSAAFVPAQVDRGVVTRLVEVPGAVGRPALVIDSGYSGRVYRPPRS